MPRSYRYPALDLGPLCVDAVNAVLGTELEPGRVWLSAKAHEHIAEDHPDDYPICFAALPLLLAFPTLIGQAPKKTDNFELHRRINHPEGKVAMAAVSLEVDAGGFYRLVSTYLVSGEVVNNRRLANRLRMPPSK